MMDLSLGKVGRHTKEFLIGWIGKGDKSRDITCMYLFADVADFSSRSTAGQLYISDRLNDFVRRALSACGITREVLYLPMGGDALCLAFIGDSHGIDTNVYVALELLKLVAEHNAGSNVKAGHETTDFQVRIGLNRHTDTRVVDINNRVSVAGSGINNAHRIMSVADGGQILMGVADYEAIRSDSPYNAPGVFQSFRAEFKQPLDLYQLKLAGRAGLNTAVPRVFSPEGMLAAFKLATTAERLALITPEEKQQGLKALVKSSFAEEATGIESFVDAVSRFSTIPRLWRTDYRIDVRATWHNESEGTLNYRVDYSWDFENYSDKDVDFVQKVILYESVFGGNAQGAFQMLRSAAINRRDVTSRFRKTELELGVVQYELPIKIPRTRSIEPKIRIEYGVESRSSSAEPWVHTVLLPIHQLTLHVEHPRNLRPSTFIYGISSEESQDNPVEPRQPLAEDEANWFFNGWFLRSHGIVMTFEKRRSTAETSVLPAK